MLRPPCLDLRTCVGNGRGKEQVKTGQVNLDQFQGLTKGCVSKRGGFDL